MSGKSKPSIQVALGAGVPIALTASGEPPEWIMLVPAGAGGVISTVDSRGPYRAANLQQLAQASLRAGDRLPLDENHATDLAAPNGGPSPARGWVTEVQARADGLWGRVEWSEPGAALMRERAYRFISPVFTHDKAGNITALLRASLTNTPNLRGMAALHSQETDMDLLAQLRKLLGLAEDADEAAVIAKITALKGDDTATASAIKPLTAALSLQSSENLTLPTLAGHVTTALASIAKAAGLQDGAGVDAITKAVTTLAGKASSDDTAIVALQAELTSVTTKLNEHTARSARERATAYVDGEVAKGRVGVTPMRDEYISMHMQDAARTEKLIGAMPILNNHGTLTPPPAKKGTVDVDVDDPIALASAADKYRTEQLALGRNLSIADAVVYIKDHAR